MRRLSETLGECNMPSLTATERGMWWAVGAPIVATGMTEFGGCTVTGLPMSGNFAMPWLKVPTNKALEADTGACTVDGIITYAIVSV